MRKILVVTGPTASGKTDLSIALAERFNGEIVSADSMQIYTGMDIGTAKPSLEERRGIPHYMLDIVQPGESYSVSKYAEDGAKCVDHIISRGKLPIVCGGTGLYINALISGTGFMKNDFLGGLRSELEGQWDIIGGESMHERLAKVDVESAEKLHVNDKKRIIRALEVFELTGMTISEHNRRTQEQPPRYDSVFIGLKTEPREVLYTRINNRVHQMMENGLVQEAQGLYDSGKLTATSAQAIGYKELQFYFKGEHTLKQAEELIAQKTRNYAKRQLTWFGSDKRVNWIIYNSIDAKNDVFHNATNFLHGFDIE